ncbi:hypothetical protein WJX72_006219 [[Myrmecia] bisecta]|uniref:GPI-anchor transamidase n=1 Tax=[Myrmecia] bisecta TaxID=41462 RepID=A0AAW1PKF0_9CHLO
MNQQFWSKRLNKAIQYLRARPFRDTKQEPQQDTWAVLVCASRYWFNYRHVANTLSVYHTVKRLGIPDSNILLMLADDMACNPRNPYPTQVFNHPDHRLNLYDDDIEVDYRGADVTVDSFLQVLTGQHHAAMPASKRLLSTNASNVLVYLTGHGGDEFLKFQDKEELMAQQMADAVGTMWRDQRYRELLFIIDTCQASTMYSLITSPRVLAMSSSKLGESSYSHHVDSDVGLAVIDRFTYFMLEFFERIDRHSKATMQHLVDYVRPKPLLSSFDHRTDLFDSPLDKLRC